MSYNVVKKIIILIGDENFTGSYVKNPTESYSYDGEKSIIDFEFNEDKKEFEFNLRELNNSDFKVSVGISKYLEDYGFYIVQISGKNLSSETNYSVDLDSLDDAKKILIGTKNIDYKDGVLLGLKKWLKNVDPDFSITPEITAICFSGSIRNSLSPLNVNKYSNKVISFITDINTFLAQIGLSPSFVFLDNICNIHSSRTFFSRKESENGEVEDGLFPLEFKSNESLKVKQISLDSIKEGLWKKYNVINTTNIITDGEFIPENDGDIFSFYYNGSKYSYLSRYKDIHGVEHESTINPGFLYSEESIEEISKLISHKILDDILKIGESLSGIKLEWIDYSDSFDKVYLFNKGYGTYDVQSLSKYLFLLDPTVEDGGKYFEDEELNNEYKKNVGKIVGELTNKHYGEVYSTDKFLQKTTFTHILLYKKSLKDNYYISAIVPFETVQTFNKDEVLKIKIRNKVENSNTFEIVVFNDDNLNYHQHSNENYYLLNENSGIISGEESNKHAGISTTSGISLNLDNILERSNRITNDISLSGDSLFINEKFNICRDRDNSVYSPYFNLTQEISPEDGEDVNSFNENIKFIKMSFDAKLGLFFWRLGFINGVYKIVIYLTTKTDSANKIIFNLEFSESDQYVFNEFYKDCLDKIRISIACSDLIINFNGKVYKVQSIKQTLDPFI